MRSVGCRSLSVSVLCILWSFLWLWALRNPCSAGSPVLSHFFTAVRSRAPGFHATLGTQGLLGGTTSHRVAVLALPPSLPSLATPSESTGGLLRSESPAPWKREGPSAAPAKLPSPRPALMCDPSLLPDVRKSFTLYHQPPTLPLVPRQTLISAGPTLSLWTLESSSHVQPAVGPQLCWRGKQGTVSISLGASHVVPLLPPSTPTGRHRGTAPFSPRGGGFNSL